MRIPVLLLLAGFGLALSGCAPEISEGDEIAEDTAELETAAAAPAPAEPEPVRPAAAPAPRPAAPAPRPAAPPPVCADCGTVTAIEEVKRKGEGSGAGAVAGAVAGGVAGHQVGGGRGKDVATVAGAVIGAMAGHEIEKRARSTSSFDVTVAMEDGSPRVINVPELGGITVGAKVRVENNMIYPRG